MFKKITKLSCSFFCNFDCFSYERTLWVFDVVTWLLLLLFFEPRRFLFQILIGKLSPWFAFAGTHFILSAQLPDYFWLLRILLRAFYRGEAVHLTDI